MASFSGHTMVVEAKPDQNSLTNVCCPNDRQLALRAQLGTGWSVRTNKPRTSKPILNHEEMDEIQSVLKRAEKVNLMEQMRIGYLIDHVEDLRMNAYGNGVTECFLCGESFGMVGGVPKFCGQCNKAVCPKCQVEICIKHQSYQLCRICSEHREIWRKSGAWFYYNELPCYILPKDGVSKSIQHTRRSVTRRCKRISRSLSRNRASSNSEDESSEDEMLAVRRRHREHLISKGLVFTGKHANTQGGQISAIQNCKANTILEASASGSNASQAHTSNTMTVGSSTSLENNREHLKEGSESGGSDTPEKTLSPSTSPTLVSKEDTPYQDRGMLEFSLTYDSASCTLQINIQRALDLPPMDVNGLADPYVKLHLLPGSTRSTKQKSSTKHKTLNPVFNESFSYFCITAEDISYKILRLSVFDEDVFGQNEFIGEVRVPLKGLRCRVVQKFELPLQRQLPLEQGDDLASEDVGKILIGVLYMFRQQCLIVTIKKCTELTSMDANGYSDPYVKVYLRPDVCKETKKKTKAIKKTLNPDFNEEFVYPNIKIQELAKKTLEVTVWDEDFGLKNDYIGGITLSMASKGEKLKHWIKLFKQPDMYHECWHKLSPEPPSVAPINLDKILHRGKYTGTHGSAHPPPHSPGSSGAPSQTTQNN